MAKGWNASSGSRPSKQLGYVCSHSVAYPLVHLAKTAHSLDIDALDAQYEECRRSLADFNPFFSRQQDFMNAVAAECKKQKHHPEWTNVFNKTHIRWTTHNPEGLSRKDTEMARFCDEAGKQFGEAEPEDEVASCYGPGGKQTT